MKKSKSKQVIEYLYYYAIEKSRSDVIEEVLNYGKIGKILWAIAHDMYDIFFHANEEDCAFILKETQQLNANEIESLSVELSNDSNVIYPFYLSIDDRKSIIKLIHKTLTMIPNQKINPKQLINIINQGFFNGKHVISIHNLHPSPSGVLRAVIKNLVNGNLLELDQRHVHHSEKYPIIDHFEIKGLLGKGAYASVYLANEVLDHQKTRTCALKVGILESEERFKREVENMKRVSHPHLLTCWNTGRFEEEGIYKYWISMENMGGLTLEHLIIAKTLDFETKLLILMQIADGLETLHKANIIHRDLKPSNCLISSSFNLKISDFGLSRDLNQQIESSQSRHANAIGTPAYMSPESITGHFGLYSDIWSFGMLAFELLSGDLPWGREIKALVLIGNIQHKTIDVRQKLASLKVPTFLVNIVDKCLKQDISQRYQNGIELKKAFYDLAKEDRNQIRYHRFKQTWMTLFEKKMIEKFIQEQVQNGKTQFYLEDFLSLQDVNQLSLDTEILGNVFKAISQESINIQLEEFLESKPKNHGLFNFFSKRKREKWEKILKYKISDIEYRLHKELAKELIEFERITNAEKREKNWLNLKHAMKVELMKENKLDQRNEIYIFLWILTIFLMGLFIFWIETKRNTEEEKHMNENLKKRYERELERYLLKE